MYFVFWWTLVDRAGRQCDSGVDPLPKALMSEAPDLLISNLVGCRLPVDGIKQCVSQFDIGPVSIHPDDDPKVRHAHPVPRAWRLNIYINASCCLTSHSASCETESVV